MIDDLATRASMTVAALVLLATGLSVLGLADAHAVRDAAEDLATHLARQIDVISSIQGEVAVGSNDSSLNPPPSLSGSPYRIEFHARQVRVVAGGTVVARALRVPIHPHFPVPAAYATADLARLDGGVVSISSGMPFVVERTVRAVDGVPAYLTFVHLPR